MVRLSPVMKCRARSILVWMADWTKGAERVARFVRSRPFLSVLITMLVLLIVADAIRKVLPTGVAFPSLVTWLVLPVMAYGLAMPIAFRRGVGSTPWLLMIWAAALTPFFFATAIVLTGGEPALMWISLGVTLLALLLSARAVNQYPIKT
jgi:hypothetical protein